ncbi:MAG TPA: AmmeMemoRadiSam system protein B [Terriglobales bacterium]|nr:AmmeMemoRadiSam system protein B [Terriglobales bacterium]
METYVRMPAVAGQFYPAHEDTLRRALETYTHVNGEKIEALGAIVPHAGYMYSGHVAGAVYGRLKLPDRFVILCPNHTGQGKPLATMSEGSWMTPLGEVHIDADLAGRIMTGMPVLHDDIEAQRHEHALEVQLPFLQLLVKQFEFVPITVGTSRFEHLVALGDAIARAIESRGDHVMIIASSDMNHYETDSTTRVKDRKAIDRVLALDAEGLYDVVLKERVTMCGFGPAIAMMTAAKAMGAKSAELIRYATSGDVSGDRDAVVGYAGIAVRK